MNEFDQEIEYTYHRDGSVNCKKYYHNGVLHRVGGPAIIKYVDDVVIAEVYYEHGEIHRDDGPAQQGWTSDGVLATQYYYINGAQHRDDGPAFIWYNLNSTTIRAEVYRQHGLRHRKDGPAEIHYSPSGVQQSIWWKNDRIIDPEPLEYLVYGTPEYDFTWDIL